MRFMIHKMISIPYVIGRQIVDILLYDSRNGVIWQKPVFNGHVISLYFNLKPVYTWKAICLHVTFTLTLINT